jgi:hypothetical protein
MTNKLFSGIFIPHKDGEYTFKDVVFEINVADIYVKWFPLQNKILKANPNIEGDIDDIFVLAENAHKRFYKQKSLATKIATELENEKQNAISMVKLSVEKNMLMIMILQDSKTIPLPFDDSMEELLNFSKTNADSGGTYWMHSIQDVMGKKYSTRVCAAFLNFLCFCYIDPKRNNDYILDNILAQIENAKDFDELASIVADFDALLLNAKSYPVDFYALSDVEAKIICNKTNFIKDIVLNLDDLVDYMHNLTDAQLEADGIIKHQIAHFRAWYADPVQATKSPISGKYDIFSLMP